MTTKSIANWIACGQVHSFARHFHIYSRFSLQVSETFTIFAPDYNYHSMNGLEATAISGIFPYIGKVYVWRRRNKIFL